MRDGGKDGRWLGTKAESRMGWYCGHRVLCPGYNAKPPGIGHEPSLVFKGAVGLPGLQRAGGRVRVWRRQGGPEEAAVQVEMGRLDLGWPWGGAGHRSGSRANRTRL